MLTRHGDSLYMAVSHPKCLSTLCLSKQSNKNCKLSPRTVWQNTNDRYKGMKELIQKNFNGVYTDVRKIALPFENLQE